MNRRIVALLASSLVLAMGFGFSCRSGGRDAALDKCNETQSASSAAVPHAAVSASPDHSAAFITLREIGDKACSLPTTVAVVKARNGAKPFEALEAHCNSGNFCDYVDVAPPGADACYVSNDHILASETKARIVPKKEVTASNSPWDGIKKPKYLDRIDAHLHLDDNEETMLRKNGFVVLDRLPYMDYAHAFHDVFQEELPLYVGIDPILHAAFQATDAALGMAEKKRLGPALDKMLAKLSKGLATSKGQYDEVTRKDLDLYLGVAHELNRKSAYEKRPPSIFKQDEAIEAISSFIANRSLASRDIFGRSRMIDASQYAPRGHYDHFDTEFSFQTYYVAMTWLTRFEWNLVSRGSRSSHPGATPDLRETPREARDALALADLFRRSGALTELAEFEEVYGAFGGQREDVGIPELLKLMDTHRIRPVDPNAPEKLKIAIGNGYRRTARMHFMPQGVTDLPAITTIMGARIAPDIAPLERLVHDDLPDRFELGAADVAYVLGHDRALAYLKNDLDTHADLKKALDAARADMEQRTNQSKDVQGAFMGTLLAMAKQPEGLLPSFMRRDAYSDFRMSSAIVGYAQLRHTFVLLSGQGYDSYGCAIPDAYVEPAAPFYAALIKHIEMLQKVTKGGHEGLGRVVKTLSAIAQTELARGAPTSEQATWLSMVAEYVPEGGYSDSGEPPKWTGWYFDMFEDREDGASKAADLIADYFTLTNAGKVAYVGTEGPRLGVFIVDTGGEPRAMVGPVARGYELKAPIAKRLNNSAARKATDKQLLFRDSFAAKPWSEPPLGLGVHVTNCTNDGRLEVRVLLAADKAVGPVTITLLDHHGDPLAPSLTQTVAGDLVVFPFLFPEVPHEEKKDEPQTPQSYEGMYERDIKYLVEAISVRIEDLSHSGLGKGPYDYFTSPSIYYGNTTQDDTNELPARPTGAYSPFVIGGRWHPPPQPSDDW